MAEDALALMMSQRDLEDLPAPVPTELYTLVIAEGEEAVLITAETLGYKICQRLNERNDSRIRRQDVETMTYQEK